MFINKLIKYILIFLIGFSVLVNSKPLPLSMENGKVIFTFTEDFANKITVAGSFNDWNDNQYPLQQQDAGIWKTSIELKPGKYEYKYIVDGQWMDGANLQLAVKKGSDGKLTVKEPGVKSNINISDKIFISGSYYTLGMYNRIHGQSWKLSGITESSPHHEVDVNFKVTLNENIEAFFQINSEKDDSIDEGHIVFNIENLELYGGRDERIIDFKDPGYILDDYIRSYNNDITFFDDGKSKFKKFGRNYLMFKMKKDWKHLPVTLFIADRYDFASQDLYGINSKLKLGPFSLGFTGIYSRQPDGLYGNVSAGNSAEFDTDVVANNYSANDKFWFEFPKNSGRWLTYDVIRMLDKEEGKNYSSKAEVQLELELEKIKLYSAYLYSNQKSAFAGYSDGIDGDRINNNYDIYKDRYFLYTGGDYDIDKFLFGFIFKNNWIKSGLELSFSDESAQEISAQNFELNSVTKKWFNVNYKFKLTLRRLDLGLNVDFKDPDNAPGVAYYMDFDNYDYLNIPIEGIQNFNRIQININSKFYSRFNFKITNYYSSYKLDDNKITDDITTNELKSKFDIRLTKKISLFWGLRWKHYKFTDFNYYYENLVQTQKKLQEDFTNLNFGFKVSFSKLKNTYFMIYYGPRFYMDDEDKEVNINLMKQYYLSNALSQSDNNMKYSYLENLVNSEDYYSKRIDMVMFEGRISF